MAKKKAVAAKSPKPKSFTGLIRDHAPAVRRIARALRDLVYEELPDAEERFYGGKHAMAMYRTTADICWIQPLKARCNIYFMRGPELSDDDGCLEGSSDRQRHAKVCSLDDLERLPLRMWLQQSLTLTEAAAASGIGFERALDELDKRDIRETPKRKLLWDNAVRVYGLEEWV